MPTHTTARTEDAAADDPLEQMQGAWRVAALKMGGFGLPAAFFSGARVEIRGSLFSATGMGSSYEGRIELQGGDERLLMKFTAGPEKGNDIHGLFAWEAGELRLCLARRGAPPPAGPTDPTVNLDLRLARVPPESC